MRCLLALTIALFAWASPATALNSGMVNLNSTSGGLARYEMVAPRPGGLNSRLTFTRASTASCHDAAGQLYQLQTNQPCYDYNPTTLEYRGLRVEGTTRTNLLTNTTAPSTQTVSSTAAIHTLSFSGSGSIVLSGTASATVAGPGVAYPSRSTLSFTPTAGNLTVTVSGSVQFAQLEPGAFATSFIYGTTSNTVRAAELVEVSQTTFAEIYGGFVNSAISVHAQAAPMYLTANAGVFAFYDGTADEQLLVRLSGAGTLSTAFVADGTVTQASIGEGTQTMVSGTIARFSTAFSANDFEFIVNNAASGTDTSGTMPTVNALRLGWQPNGPTVGNFWYRRLYVVPYRLPSAALRGLNQ
ncbi:hypothetical protein UFOVP315_12 [uncultured Caudovirales phage]|uniref:Uncharacterized protein n=1 Tax=uncultured Caudovirales phage TaxID=2100421 RepID=A0A6J5LVJ1_9CAUD|nr:hypothetical protein UFOVP315_12 [uncultured Caudovirales phage]